MKRSKLNKNFEIDRKTHHIYLLKFNTPEHSTLDTLGATKTLTTEGAFRDNHSFSLNCSQQIAHAAGDIISIFQLY